MKNIIALILIARFAQTVAAQAPSEDFLKANLIGTWVMEVSSDGIKSVSTASYSKDGIVEYRIRQAGSNEDLARWSSRYAVKKNCIEDVVVRSSNEHFSAIGEEDRECVLATELDARRMHLQSAQGDQQWLIKISDAPGDERCLQPVRAPACKRAAFLQSPKTFELNDGQSLATSTFALKVFGTQWAALNREARSHSDIRLVMLVDGTNILTIMTGGTETASLSELFKAQVAAVARAAPDFSRNAVKTQDAKLAGGQRLKIRRSCGALPTKVRICVLAGMQSKAGLSITSTYIESETKILEMIKSIRLLTK